MHTRLILSMLVFLSISRSGSNVDGDDKKGKVMKSKNYRIELSTTAPAIATMESNSHRLRGTLGQVLVGDSRSKHYRLETGFWPVVARKLKRINPKPPS